MPVASQNLTTNMAVGIMNISKTAVIGSLGKGGNADMYFGIRLSSSTDLEVNLFYLQSAKYTGVYEKDTTFFQNTAIFARIVRAAPCVRFHTNDSLRTFYFKIGPIVRIAGEIISQNRFYDFGSQSTTFYTWRFNKGMSIGGFAAVGLNQKLTHRLKLFAELNFVAQSWAPERGGMTEFTIDGINMLHTLNTSQKETHYERQVTENMRKKSGWEHSSELKQHFPLSSFGLLIGVQMGLSKKMIK